MKANQEVRDAAIKRKVRLWQIADALGIHEVTLTKRLRYELADADKANIMSIIERLRAEREIEVQA